MQPQPTLSPPTPPTSPFSCHTPQRRASTESTPHHVSMRAPKPDPCKLVLRAPMLSYTHKVCEPLPSPPTNLFASPYEAWRPLQVANPLCFRTWLLWHCEHTAKCPSIRFASPKLHLRPADLRASYHFVHDYLASLQPISTPYYLRAHSSYGHIGVCEHMAKCPSIRPASPLSAFPAVSVASSSAIRVTVDIASSMLGFRQIGFASTYGLHTTTSASPFANGCPDVPADLQPLSLRAPKRLNGKPYMRAPSLAPPCVRCDRVSASCEHPSLSTPRHCEHQACSRESNCEPMLVSPARPCTLRAHSSPHPKRRASPPYGSQLPTLRAQSPLSTPETSCKPPKHSTAVHHASPYALTTPRFCASSFTVPSHTCGASPQWMWHTLHYASTWSKNWTCNRRSSTRKLEAVAVCEHIGQSCPSGNASTCVSSCEPTILSIAYTRASTGVYNYCTHIVALPRQPSVTRAWAGSRGLDASSLCSIQKKIARQTLSWLPTPGTSYRAQFKRK